jgi:hypothetical protein
MGHNHLSAKMFVAMSHRKSATASQLTFITHQFEYNCNTNDQRLSPLCSAQLEWWFQYSKKHEFLGH